jgi:hypothetical protein
MMTRVSPDSKAWTIVDEGWGRRAVEFSTLSEPGNCREYVASHHLLSVDAGDSDPDLFARALASTGPAYEAIQNVGEAAFHDAAVDQARQHVRAGLPLRAEINVVGYLARTAQEEGIEA